MRISNRALRLSASDLANHLGCRHLTYLDLLVARKEMGAPSYRDPALEALQKRGFEHEAAYVQHLKDQGLSIIALPDFPEADAGSAATVAAMREGSAVIVQATLLSDGWLGRADILRRVETPSDLGGYSYEVLDTKLARETRGRTILQLCLYSDIVGEIQGRLPEAMHVVPPGVDFVPESYRVDHYMAYYRLVRSRLQEAVADGVWNGEETYPDPCEQCDICRWWKVCNDRRHEDDHLSLVAGIRKMQIGELEERDVDTLASLATATLPFEPKPKRGSCESYERVHHQARVQLTGRQRKEPVHEMLPLEPDFGLFRLPEPTPKDIFFDFEAARFVGDEGLEYLFGVVSLDGDENPQYESIWALTPAEEKNAFEQFIDDAMARWEADEGFHIYHYAPYEPAAIKRLMGRYATREDEVDRLLRGERFVDLYAVVKQSLRASVEKYSIKDLEPFFGFERAVELRAATQNMQVLEFALEFESPDAIPEEVHAAVEGYNRDDCLSTLHLRNWLESLRAEMVASGHEIPRPELKSGDPSDKQTEILDRVQMLRDMLVDGIPVDRADRSTEQQAQWILAQLLEWHWREEKAIWWEYYRLLALTEEDLLDERAAISHLSFVERIAKVKKSYVERYRFPPQETELRRNDELKTPCTRQTDDGTIVKSKNFGKIQETDLANWTVDLLKGPSIVHEHPSVVFKHEKINTDVLSDTLFRIGEWVAEHGIDVEGPYRAGRDLLLGKPPRLKGDPIEIVRKSADEPLEAARNLVCDLDGGLLPIQGPPGSGKTYTGGRMICAAVKEGLKVGITAVSHKVIRNLLDEAVSAAKEEGLDLRCIQRVKPESALESTDEIHVEKGGSTEIFNALESGDIQVAAGTAWLWARKEAANAIDVLFVDEAGQISLANSVAVSQAAKSVVLLGDPQQLEQPKRGSHPDGTDVSALEHMLGEHQTMPPDRGLFLETTWRLHPSICAFTSELFYESRLHPRPGLDVQAVCGESEFAGAGLHFVPVQHEGNCNESSEEAEVVARLMDELTADGMTWINQHGEEKPMTLDDVLVVAPYNAQVGALLERLPKGARVGTVDKFQGQEAPIVIYSMASSSPEEAPRGMEFLYSPSRLNVATSRARCACILVANPRLFEPDCRTPRQMKLANAFCRYLELVCSSGG